jgi:membrane-bound metal-dependent hydrolase YbcI (DUF457 family)
MTQVGHALTGTAIAVMCLPEKTSLRYRFFHFAAFMALSLVPDYRFENWGHNRYDISHSLFVNLLWISALVILLAMLSKARITIGGWTVIAAGGAAWLSHLLLDSFYNHGKGIAIFWPLSKARLVLPIPWLSVVKQLPPPVTRELLQILLIEFVTFSPLVLLAILIRKRALKTND